MKSLLGLYYTGTGNTLRGMEAAAELFRKEGWSAELKAFPLPVSRRSRTLPAAGTGEASGPAQAPDLLLTGFPVLGFSAPVTVLRALRALPPGEGRPAAVFCFVGSEYSGGRIVRGWSGAAALPVLRILRKRGYRAEFRGDISYPANWTQMIPGPGEEKALKMVEEGDREIREAVRNFLSGEAAPPVRKGLKHLPIRLVGFLFRRLGRPGLVRTFTADSRCTGCGICASRCPAGALVIKHGRPWWRLRCTDCNRCINICPVHAIQTSLVRLILVPAVNLAALVFVWPVSRVLAARYFPDLPPGVSGTVRTVLALALFTGFSFLQLGPLDGLLKVLERIPGLGRLFSRSFTRKFRRYTAPGFRG